MSEALLRHVYADKALRVMLHAHIIRTVLRSEVLESGKRAVGGAA